MKRKLFRILVQLMAPDNHWKKFFSILLTSGLIFFVLTDVAFAVDPTVTPSGVDFLLDIFAGVITKLALGVGQIAILLIGMVTIPLLQYNEFVTSPVVGMGWAIVRDAVNMFYVIVLILIAFGTVLGIERYKWREQIPRLLGMAVIVNFSRTLCGIMIDFSQIMTLTFVNAIKDIAGGNFVQLFGITSILDANTASQLFDASGATPPGSFDIFIASIVALIMMLIVLITILFLTIVFAYRIVLLWALVTIAPLAWFFKGAQGALTAKKDPYGTWWTRFSCALQVGPILSFFLWLALAVAGSGNLASTAGFTTSNAPAGEGLDVGSILKAMSMDQMIGFVVGIALIFVGFDAASDACASDGNISGLLKKGKDLMQPIAMAPVAGAALAAKYGWKGARVAQKGLYNQTVGRGMAKTRNMAGSVMGKLGTSGLMPTAARGFFANQSAKIKAKETAEAEATVKDKPMSKDALVAYLKGGPSALDVNNRQYSARLKEAMGREDVMEDLTKDPEQLKKILGQKMGGILGFGGRDTAQTRFLDTFDSDPAATKQLDNLKKKMPTVFGGVSKIQEADDIKDLPVSQLKNPEVFDQIRGLKHEFIDSNGVKKEQSMVDAIKDGKLGRPAKERWLEAEAEMNKQRKASRLTPTSSAEDIEKTMSWDGEESKAAEILSSGDPKKVAALHKSFGTSDLLRDAQNTTDPVKKKLAEDKLGRLLNSGEMLKDKGERRAFRHQMVARGMDVTKAFNLIKNPTTNQFEFAGEGKDDFEAGLSGNPEHLAVAMHEVEKNGGNSNDLETIAANRAKEVVDRLLALAQASSSTTQKEYIKEQASEIFTAKVMSLLNATDSAHVVGKMADIDSDLSGHIKKNPVDKVQLKADLLAAVRKGVSSTSNFEIYDHAGIKQIFKSEKEILDFIKTEGL